MTDQTIGQRAADALRAYAAILPSSDAYSILALASQLPAHENALMKARDDHRKASNALREVGIYPRDAFEVYDVAERVQQAANQYNVVVHALGAVASELGFTQWKPEELSRHVRDLKYSRDMAQQQAKSAPPRNREVDRANYTDPLFNEWLDQSVTENGERTVWNSLDSIQSAWDAWNGLDARLKGILSEIEGLGGPHINQQVQWLVSAHQEMRQQRQDVQDALTRAGIPPGPDMAHRVDLLVTERDALRDDIIAPCMNELGLDVDPYPSLVMKVRSVKAAADQLAHIHEMVKPCPTSVYDRVRTIMTACQDAQSSLMSPNVIVQNWPEEWEIKSPRIVSENYILLGPGQSSVGINPRSEIGRFFQALINVRQTTPKRPIVGEYHPHAYTLAQDIVAEWRDGPGEWIVFAPHGSVSINPNGGAVHRMMYAILTALQNERHGV